MKNFLLQLLLVSIFIAILYYCASLGHENGYDEGYSAGYDEAHHHYYEEGYSDGHWDGYDEGYDEGYDGGWESGFEDGYECAMTDDPEINFWRDFAVIVTSTGEKYHTYGCYHIDGRKFNIYNISSAKAQGYTACLDCIG